jgi:hypothetical protein
MSSYEDQDQNQEEELGHVEEEHVEEEHDAYGNQIRNVHPFGFLYCWHWPLLKLE